MSSAVFPALQGLTFPIIRTPQWGTIIHEAVSGKEYRVAKRGNPRRVIELSFDLLKGPTLGTDLATLEGFFNARTGAFDSFLIALDEDNTVAAQSLGTGDGVTTTFQLKRAFGAATETIFAPNVVSHVYDNGVDGGGWSVQAWGAAVPGLVTYGAAPAAGHAITADFTYYWPVRFQDDSIDFERFMNLLWAQKSVKLITLVSP